MDEYSEVIEVINKRFFNKRIDFNLALENSKKSFEECRYFFEKIVHHEPTSIDFYFLCALALAMNSYVLNNTDFDLDKTKSQLFQKKHIHFRKKQI